MNSHRADNCRSGILRVLDGYRISCLIEMYEVNAQRIRNIRVVMLSGRSGERPHSVQRLLD